MSWIQNLRSPVAAGAPSVLEVERETLARDYKRVRSFTEELCVPLETEDYIVQTMPDVSPTKWHIAHVSWFFETFLLSPHLKGYKSPNPLYNYLFNSYYNGVGSQHCRPRRGTLSRPTVKEVYAYRHHVDSAMLRLIENCDEAQFTELAPLVTLGLNHEQQHQELLITDILNVMAANPLRPAYQLRATRVSTKGAPLQWISFDEGIHEVGFAGEGFCYDNEGPRHRALVLPFKLANRPVTCGEWLQFIEAGGYQEPLLWLSAGWAQVKANNWEAPFYWDRDGEGRWWHMTLNGYKPVVLDKPVCHVSYFEADAFARWAGARLPTEFEWEVASASYPETRGNFVEDGVFEPLPSLPGEQGGLLSLFGDVWEWTGSQYTPYPGYKAAPGAIGEYNGKFMCNQFVLRGGSFATSRTHIRRTYRNFFQPEARWQMTGLRLAQSV